MTSPGEGAPDGAYVVGSPGDYGRPESEIVGQWTNKIGGGFQNSQGSFAVIFSDILSRIGAVVADVITGIASGVVAVGGALVTAVTSIVDGIVNLIQNLAGAVLGGGARAAAKGLPSTFEPGGFADIMDGQRDLLDRFDLLDDNAGFINVTMSKNWNVSAGSTMRHMQYDTLVTAPKNARLINFVEGGSVVGKCIMFDAPGVWDIRTQLTIDPNTSSDRYSNVHLAVMKGYYVAPGEDSSGERLVWSESYSWSRSDNAFINNHYETINIIKPTLIPEDDVTPGGRFKYAAVVMAMASGGSAKWKVLGGTRYSSFSALRQSTDTTDYGAPQAPTATGELD